VGTGVNTAGVTGTYSGGVSNNAKVGAHDKHLRGGGGFKPGGIACTDCHAVTALSDSGHMNGSTSFVWSSLATHSGVLTPSYNPANGTCSNVYCHGAATTIVATQGTDTTPVWTDGAYVTTDATVTTNSPDCNKCHQSPAFNNATFDHSGVTLAIGNCNSCHTHDGAGAKHIDGVLDAIGGVCDSCHDYDVNASGDWGKSPKAVEGWGAHATHIAHLKTVSGATLSASADNFNTANFNAVCGVCHTRNSGNHVMGGSPTRSINFGDGLAPVSFASGSAPVYSGVSGTSSQYAPKTCSNISCHFQTTPVWQGY
jgi:predicted CxxxxCH...CXXCH cytochrome family protein